MSYKYHLCPFEDGNYAIVEINYIGNDANSNINIDKSRLDTIPYNENDRMIGCNCKKCKQQKLINEI